MNPEQIAALLEGKMGAERLDAAATATLARQLEHVKAKTYDVKYGAFKARQFIPVDPDQDPAADTIVYHQWDQFGAAKLLANPSDDLPLVDVSVQEFRSPVRSLGAAYGYSIMDLRRAAKTGSNLDAKKAAAARRAVEARIDYLAAYGDAASGIPGFLTNPNVTTDAATTGTWSSATALQMLQDLHDMAADAVDAGGDVFVPDTILLPSAEFAKAATTPMAADNTRTVLSTFIQENPWITNVDTWRRLDSVNGVKLAVVYTRSPEVLTLNIPQEFEQLPPEAKGLGFEIPCHARMGGTTIHYPVAVRYITGL